LYSEIIINIFHLINKRTKGELYAEDTEYYNYVCWTFRKDLQVIL